MEAFKLIADLGFSIAAVIGGGFFIIMLLKYILQSVVNSANTIKGMISALDNRVKTMNNEIVRLDALICHTLGVKPDVRRICLLYTSPSPRDGLLSRMPSSA